jgi:hypothetical protein
MAFSDLFLIYPAHLTLDSVILLMSAHTSWTCPLCTWFSFLLHAASDHKTRKLELLTKERENSRRGRGWFHSSARGGCVDCCVCCAGSLQVLPLTRHKWQSKWPESFEPCKQTQLRMLGQLESHSSALGFVTSFSIWFLQLSPEPSPTTSKILEKVSLKIFIFLHSLIILYEYHNIIWILTYLYAIMNIWILINPARYISTNIPRTPLSTRIFTVNHIDTIQHHPRVNRNLKQMNFRVSRRCYKRPQVSHLSLSPGVPAPYFSGAVVPHGFSKAYSWPQDCTHHPHCSYQPPYCTTLY